MYIYCIYTVNQLIFVAVMFRIFLLQDSFAKIEFRDNQNAKRSNFSRNDIAADIGCFFITRVVFRNILLIVRLTYPIDFVNTFY